MGRHQYWAGRVYDLCVYYMTGTPEGSTESVFFMEKPGIEPATPGTNDPEKGARCVWIYRCVFFKTYFFLIFEYVVF